VLTDAELNAFQAVLVTLTAYLAADPSTTTVDATARCNSISGDACAVASWVARGRQDGRAVAVGRALVADDPPPTDVAAVVTGSSTVGLISGWACAETGERVTATVDDCV